MNNPKPEGGLDPETLRWLAREEDEERRLCEVRAKREDARAERVRDGNATDDRARFLRYAKQHRRYAKQRKDAAFRLRNLATRAERRRR